MKMFISFKKFLIEFKNVIMGNSMMYYESCPTQIRHLLTAEAVGTIVPRLVLM
jgi:hypothetical protein